MDRDVNTEDLTGKYVVLREGAMAEEYRDLKFRVVRAEGGFGCSPTALGSAVFVHSPYDGESWRMERGHVERFATDEEIVMVGGELDPGVLEDERIIRKFNQGDA